MPWTLPPPDIADAFPALAQSKDDVAGFRAPWYERVALTSRNAFEFWVSKQLWLANGRWVSVLWWLALFLWVSTVFWLAETSWVSSLPWFATRLWVSLRSVARCSALARLVALGFY